MIEEPSMVDGELDRLRQIGAGRSHRLGPDHAELWSALTAAGTGGKCFRPSLLVTSHDNLGGTQPVAAARTAAAVETLHTAFLIHDDVIDGDDRRRGRPNVSGTFAAIARQHGGVGETPRAYGAAAGILAGDLALVSALRTVASCGAATPVTETLLDLFEAAMHATATGELADVRLGLGLGDGATTVADAIRVAELKTAAYSFQLPLQAGAVLAEADPSVVATLGEVGRRLGIGFQLWDDLLGVFGDETRTGKSNLSDLREGKCTALIAHARTTSAWPALQRLVGAPGLDFAAARHARTLLTSCGAHDLVRHLAEEYLDSGLTTAIRAGLPPSLITTLTDLIDQIRDSARYGMADRTPEKVETSG
ncbi:polyprenyl synthetase family protein [Parenemella sanctibonifatiensis]|nr:polyprenyl synthetase family protein [Parenemella sanctibonifatiensis]